MCISRDNLSWLLYNFLSVNVLAHLLLWGHSSPGISGDNAGFHEHEDKENGANNESII